MDDAEGLGLAMTLSGKQDKKEGETETKEKNLYEICKDVKVTAALKTRQNKFKYLQWADAWAAVLSIDPHATYKVIKNADGFPCFANTFGAMVYTEVTILGVTREQHLPVFNNENKPLKLETYTYKSPKKDNGKVVFENGKKVYIDKFVPAIDMMEVNNTIQRCVVKNIAAFGLGLTVYRGQE